MITHRVTPSGLRVHVAVTPHRVGIGDGTVHSPTQAPVLTARNVVVNASPRRGSARRAPWPPHVRRQRSMLRQPIATAVSALSAMFDIQRSRARSPKGVVCRVVTQPLLVQFLTRRTPNERLWASSGDTSSTRSV
jgi:hypothetical protein